MNNNQNNEGFNAFSLGSVGDNNVNFNNNVPVGDLPPVTPVNEVPQTLESVPTGLDAVTPINNEIGTNVAPNPMPGVDSTLPNMGETAGIPVNPSPVATPDNLMNEVPISGVATPPLDVPQVMDSVNTTPFFNEIGTVPPIPNVPDITPPPTPNDAPAEVKAPKKKGGVNKIIFVLIIVLALTAVGVGLYIFLNLSNKPGANTGNSNVVVKDVKIELGEPISTNIDDYATFKKVDKTTCSLDTSNITDTTKIADYTFTITCAGKTYEGKASVVDTTAPVVVTKDLVVGVDKTVKPGDFIESCTDKSTCSYAFKDEKTVLENLKTAGEYEVIISVRDGSNNIVDVKAKLTVNGALADLYVNCNKTSGNLAELLKLGIVNNEFNKVGNEIYTYTLDEASYNALKTESAGKTIITYNDKTGTATFNDENLTVAISTVVSYEELVAVAGKEVPLTISELRSFYNDLGYSCSIGY